MSRLIVKNLPPYATPDRLRRHFEQKGAPNGTITDVKVPLKPDGTARRFGFIGFKTEKEADAAKKWFDCTFIDSARISIAVVEGAKDAPAPRPNKRLRVGPFPTDGVQSAVIEEASRKSKKADKVLSSKEESDPQLSEFLQVMQPRTKKGRTWANEIEEPDSRIVVLAQSSDDLPEAADEHQDAPHDTNEEISDLDWMRRRMTENIDSKVPSQAKMFHQSDDEVEEDVEKDKSDVQGEKDPTREIIQRTSRLFLRNLAFSCAESDLMTLFSRHGEVAQIHIPIDSISKQPKGLAYVKFAQSSSALAAYDALDKTSFQGRLLHILPAVERNGKAEPDQSVTKKSLRDEKHAKRKGMAGKGFDWGMLYMNSDAVVSSVADRMNISKSDILNPENDNAAVKLALAETHVIQETKSYLESQGVVLSSFSSRARSDTTILVKNIPYGTTADQIREMFEVHGVLSRVLVPPAGTMAVVEFVHADEASKAFRAIAYRRLGNSIIYLEKGPLDMFSSSADDTESSQGPIVATASRPVTIAEQENEITASGVDEPPLSAGTTLFVKNLAFSTTSERLTQVFRNLPSFAFARVQTKPDPKRPAVTGTEAPRLSMGYGFVGFKAVEDAKKAMKSMQGYVLDGHALHVKFAGRGVEEDTSSTKNTAKSTSTKMIVKNVPFEATRKDIRELFSAHGHLKSVRLPKKFDSRSRGFAFLEFLTRHEAENAYNALRHTHLLGRHLVLEWAEEAEQDLDALRTKAGVGYGGGAELPGRKRKLELAGDGDGEGEVED